MSIHILHTLEGARRARGLAVVIDVFRAFTTACFAHAAGARRILPVADLDLAYGLKREDPKRVLMGERDCRIPEGFDYGNSPAHLEGADLSGKTVIHTTSAGTQGLVAASASADEVVTASFVNAAAVARYIEKSGHSTVCLVAMGTHGAERSPEDDMCAIYIKNAVEGYPNSFETLAKFLPTIESAEKFFEPEKESYAPRRDLDLCLDLDRFDFVLRAEGDGDGNLHLTGTSA